MTNPTRPAPPDVYETGLRLWNDWIEMWNGRPELALVLVADRFSLHLTTPRALRQETINTPAAVEQWVTGHRANFKGLVFRTGCGPYVDVAAGVVAGPWFAETSPDGSTPPVCGMDTIAFANGKVTEYWTLSREVDAVGRWITAERQASAVQPRRG